MKKALWYVAGTVFLLSTLAFAADNAASPDKVGPVKTTKLSRPPKCMLQEKL